MPYSRERQERGEAKGIRGRYHGPCVPRGCGEGLELRGGGYLGGLGVPGW